MKKLQVWNHTVCMLDTEGEDLEVTINEQGIITNHTTPSGAKVKNVVLEGVWTRYTYIELAPDQQPG